jgi:hypothetical protein
MLLIADRGRRLDATRAQSRRYGRLLILRWSSPQVHRSGDSALPTACQGGDLGDDGAGSGRTAVRRLARRGEATMPGLNGAVKQGGCSRAARRRAGGRLVRPGRQTRPGRRRTVSAARRCAAGAIRLQARCGRPGCCSERLPAAVEVEHVDDRTRPRRRVPACGGQAGTPGEEVLCRGLRSSAKAGRQAAPPIGSRQIRAPDLGCRTGDHCVPVSTRCTVLRQ